MRRISTRALYKETRAPGHERAITQGEFQYWPTAHPAAQPLWLRFVYRCDCAGRWKTMRESVPFLSVDLTIAGEVDYEVGGQRHATRGGDVHLIMPGQTYSIGASRECRRAGLELTGNLLLPLLESLNLKQSLTIAPRDFGAFAVALDGIYTLFQQKAPGSEASASAQLYQYLGALAGEVIPNATPVMPLALIELLRLIHADPATPHSCRDFASRVGCSVPTMIRLFHRYLETTPEAYINRFRMNYARQILLDRELSIKEVATLLGFKNQYYFSRVFKKCFGYPPSRAPR